MNAHAFKETKNSTAIFIVGSGGSVKELAAVVRKLEDLELEVAGVETRMGDELAIYTKPASYNPEAVLNALKTVCKDVRETALLQGQGPTPHWPLVREKEVVPWFPRRISELDTISNNVFMYGKDLDADHPGFKDEAYRKRRIYFADIAYQYKYGKPIPRVEYTESEKRTWGVVYRELLKVYQTHACKEFLENLPLLQKYAGYREDDLPQLEDVSNFLKWRSGFTVRPVAGYISARDFLYGLAFRVFYCTQYIRHEADPFYTPEPDCVHELMGHMPLLANPAFARFSQELGLASLGACESDVKKLASLYFFTVEFGLCKQDGKLRAYGAGLLSSVAELRHALSDKAVTKPFVPEDVIEAECMVTTYQNAYFTSTSFEEAEDKLRHFVLGIKRPFSVYYNAYTECVEVLDSPQSVAKVLDEVKAQLSSVDDALNQFVIYEGGRPLKVWEMADPKIMA